MTFLVPSKPQPVEEQVTEADNLSSIGESEETGSGGSTTTSDEISGATEDLRTVASVNPTQLDKFVDEIFNSFTHVDAEDDGDEESDDDEEEEDTVMEMTRLKNQRGLIMSPNATSMNVSDEYIMGHSNTWASAFGWKKQTRKDDERDLRIMESDDSDSLGSYDEEDIPTDYEDFSVDKDEEEGSWYDDVEDDRDDSWDVGSMFKLHKNPSDVYVSSRTK